LQDKNRVTILNAFISVHGLVKVAYAGMCTEDGLRQCASKNAPRNISEEKLTLITYRLNDKLVWESKEWLRIKKKFDAELKSKESGVKRKPTRKVKPPKS